MKRIRLKMIPFAVLTFSALLVMQAQSDQRIQPKKAKLKSASARPLNQVEPVMAPVEVSRQGYQMVSDVLDGFGGESESDNYRIPVNSGGQPSPAGFSESSNWGMGAGFVYASHVKRGDATADGLVNVADIVYLVNYLYRGGDEPCPPEAGDATRDCVVNVADIVYLVNYLYRGGDPPAC